MRKFIPVAEPSITQREADYVLDALRSGWVSSLGKYIDAFERGFAEYSGVRFALTTTSGTTALHLSLVSLGIKEGDEVILPDFTFVATANAVTYTGAKPVFVDIDRETWCLEPESFERAITERTKAVIPVHVYGHPSAMDSINGIAKKRSIFVLEDAAESLGAEYQGKKVGSLGDAGIFSFYGNKIITTGEGGIITTDNEEIYERAKYLRDHAMSSEKRYWHTEIGFNYRMTNLQAALGLAQLERIDEIIGKKRKIFNWYRRELGNVDGLSLNPEKEWAKNVVWMVCLVMEADFGLSRDELMGAMRAESIDSRPFFYPMSQLPMYEGSGVNPVAYDLSRRGLNLPSGFGLTGEDVGYICSKVKAILIG